jgi:hypothetical protein
VYVFSACDLRRNWVTAKCSWNLSTFPEEKKVSPVLALSARKICPKTGNDLVYRYQCEINNFVFNAGIRTWFAMITTGFGSPQKMITGKATLMLLMLR